MPRVTTAEVQPLVPTSEDTTAFLTSASRWVDTHLEGSSLLTDDDLTRIELHLAVHFAQVRDPRVKEESLPDGMRYVFALESTHLTIAAMLDRTGTLTAEIAAAAGTTPPPRARFKVF